MGQSGTFKYSSCSISWVLLCTILSQFSFLSPWPLSSTRAWSAEMPFVLSNIFSSERPPFPWVCLKGSCVSPGFLHFYHLNSRCLLRRPEPGTLTKLVFSSFCLSHYTFTPTSHPCFPFPRIHSSTLCGILPSLMSINTLPPTNPSWSVNFPLALL